MIAPLSISPDWWGRIRSSSGGGDMPHAFYLAKVKEIRTPCW